MTFLCFLHKQAHLYGNICAFNNIEKENGFVINFMKKILILQHCSEKSLPSSINQPSQNTKQSCCQTQYKVQYGPM